VDGGTVDGGTVDGVTVDGVTVEERPFRAAIALEK
jgi:hypothetical protein